MVITRGELIDFYSLLCLNKRLSLRMLSPIFDAMSELSLTERNYVYGVFKASHKRMYERYISRKSVDMVVNDRLGV